MTITTTYPGIYTEETNNLAVSITHSRTAVPAFIFHKGEAEAPQSTTRYTSWKQFSSERENHTGYIYWNAIKAWFMLNGGPCYLVPTASALADIPRYEEITLLVATGQNINDLVDQLCLPGRNLFALLDGPDKKIDTDSVPDEVMKNYPATPYAAVWYPWLKYTWPTDRHLPPSVVAAAAIANTDSSRGVWKSPSNFVVNIFKPRFRVTDDLQGRFNSDKALNMIRTFPDQGTVIWGARTLEDSDNWRYIAVRRLFNSVEYDIKKALQKFVFEPNSQPTWSAARAIIDNYLYRLWQQGALAGNKPEEAWYTKIAEGTTMTKDDIKQGKMNITIGMAAVRPAEFIVLQFSQSVAL